MSSCLCAGPGAPHGAWPLVAANFGTRGCHGPTHRNSVDPVVKASWENNVEEPEGLRSGQMPGQFELPGVFELLGQRQQTRGRQVIVVRRGTGRWVGMGAASRCDPGEGRGSEDGVHEIPFDHSREYGVDQLAYLLRSGRDGHTADHFGNGRMKPAVVELSGSSLWIGVDPGAKQVQTPQGSGQRIRRGTGPELSQGLDALGLGQVNHAMAKIGVGSVGSAHQNGGRAIGRLREQGRIDSALDLAEQPGAWQQRPMMWASRGASGFGRLVHLSQLRLVWAGIVS